MSNTTYIGTFCIRDQGALLAMPVPNKSGLWQAWRLPDGDLLIQPLDDRRNPWGAASLMAKQAFYDLLSPYAPPLLPGEVQDPVSLFASPPPPCLPSDSPDLLTLWYKQSLEPSPLSEEELMHLAPLAAEQEAGPDAEPEPYEDPLLALQEPYVPSQGQPLPAQRPPFAQSGAPLAGNEDAAWDPDDIFFDDQALHEPFAAAPGPATEPAPSPPPPPPPAREKPVPEAPAQEDAGSGAGVEAVAETKATQLEQAMRAQFAEMLHNAANIPDDELEEAICRLILRGSVFTWKQKYMFTEFGLALRRQKKHKAALACHLRALHFAPEDEHILFNVARAEYELGNADRAVGYLERALAAAPAFSVAANFLAFLRGAVKKN